MPDFVKPLNMTENVKRDYQSSITYIDNDGLSINLRYYCGAESLEIAAVVLHKQLLDERAGDIKRVVYFMVEEVNTPDNSSLDLHIVSTEKPPIGPVFLGRSHTESLTL